MTREELKKFVKRRHKELKSFHDTPLTLSDIYEITSREKGFKDWNTYSAYLKEKENAEQRKN